MTEQNQRKLSAIMFVDIVAYSKMMGSDEEATLKLLDDYKKIVTPVVQNNNGTIVKWLGDGLFCEFGSAISAADCALNLHQKLATYNKQKGHKYKINIRVGIHLGEVTRKDNDIFGDGVNVAARIESQAPKGGIAISGVVYSVLKSYPRFKIIKMEKRQLKNIDFHHDLFCIKTGFEIDSDVTPDDKVKNLESAVTTKKKQSVLTSKFAIGLITIVIISALIYSIPNIINTNDTHQDSINNEISDNQKSLIASQKYQQFYRAINSHQEYSGIIDFLVAEQKKGKLSFGNESDFHSTDKKCIVVMDGHDLNTVVVSIDNIFIDLQNYKIKKLKSDFIGNRLIWVELY